MSNPRFRSASAKHPPHPATVARPRSAPAFAAQAKLPPHAAKTASSERPVRAPNSAPARSRATALEKPAHPATIAQPKQPPRAPKPSIARTRTSPRASSPNVVQLKLEYDDETKLSGRPDWSTANERRRTAQVSPFKLTIHHIVPWSVLRGAINDALSAGDRAVLAQLHRFAFENGRQEEEPTLEAILAGKSASVVQLGKAVFNNPVNLFFGPVPEHRTGQTDPAGDPGDTGTDLHRNWFGQESTRSALMRAFEAALNRPAASKTAKKERAKALGTATTAIAAERKARPDIPAFAKDEWTRGWTFGNYRKRSSTWGGWLYESTVERLGGVQYLWELGSYSLRSSGVLSSKA